MSETNKPREFWMDTDLLDRALDNCDLGDGYSAKVRQYPHKDMLSELTRVIEFSAYKRQQEQIRILREALNWYSDNWRTNDEDLRLEGYKIADKALAQADALNETKETE